MPLPDQDFPLHNHDLGVPGQAVVTRMDLVRVAIVIERPEVDGADGRRVGDVLLRIERSAMSVSIYALQRSDGLSGPGPRARLSLRRRAHGWFWEEKPSGQN